MKDKLEDICLGEKVCRTCQSDFCLLGYTKILVKKVLNHEDIDLDDVSKKILKKFDKNKVISALELTLNILKTNWNDVEFVVLHEIRKTFELLLFYETIEEETYEKYATIYSQKKISIN